MKAYDNMQRTGVDLDEFVSLHQKKTLSGKEK